MSLPSNRVAVINLVALSKQVLAHMPALSSWAKLKTLSSFKPAFPAVTCTAQSTYITGLNTEQHGIHGNGWYNRSMSEIQFWKQSNHLVQGPRIWEKLRERFGEDFTCAKLFWWYNMYSTANWSITPRPMYPADGRKVFDIYTQPMDLKDELKADLGAFPFPTFWGPMAGLPSTQWIINSAKWIEDKHHPHLSLIYLPHLDYDLQRFGPSSPEAQKCLKEMDDAVMDLIHHLEQSKVDVIVLSEYGISDVDTPIALNRIFRHKGWITIKPELGTEMLDAGASKAFAVADHQTALIYLNDPSIKEEVYKTLMSTPGVEEVRAYTPSDYPYPPQERTPDFVAISEPNAWFSYYYWEDDRVAPDFARCIDIHRKPGYDPAELFFDPKLKFPKAHALAFLAKKTLGFRALMKIIALNGDQVKGSHGRDNLPENQQPVMICQSPVHSALEVHEAILNAFNASQ